MRAYRPAPKDEVLYHEEAGEAFLLHVPTGEYFGLNRSGVVVWKAVCDGLDPEDELARQWPDAARANLRDDAESLLRSLRDAGLIVEVEAGGEADQTDAP